MQVYEHDGGPGPYPDRRTQQDANCDAHRRVRAHDVLVNGACSDPTPNAILRIQRLKDNSGLREPGITDCDYAPAVTGANNSNDYWPNVLFDPREGLQRDAAPTSGLLVLGGMMHYMALDVANLSKWFKGTAPYAAGQGLNAISRVLPGDSARKMIPTGRLISRNG